MSFGFSISDFIAIIELATKIRKNIISAPRQFKDITDETRSLSITLQDVDVALEDHELSDVQRRHLEEITENCRNVLHELQKTLEKYRHLESCHKYLGTRRERVWMRARWEPEDIRDLRSRITSNVTLLNTFLGRISR